MKLVARLFYRDEYVVVLDAVGQSFRTCVYFLRWARRPPVQLTREVAISDSMSATDGSSLEQMFALPHRQVRRILIDLERDKLVCFEKDVTERRNKKMGTTSCPAHVASG